MIADIALAPSDDSFRSFRQKLLGDGKVLYPRIRLPDGVACLYVLVDPRDDEIKYVGYTKDFRRRYYVHTYEARRGVSHKNYWVGSLMRQGLLPLMVPWGCPLRLEDAKLAEITLIKFFRQKIALVNGTDGGDGTPGHQMTERNRLELSGRLRKSILPKPSRERPLTRHTEESVQKIIDANAGESNHQAKLTWPLVREMRRQMDEGVPNIDVAKKFGMSPTQVSRIRRNIAWQE